MPSDKKGTRQYGNLQRRCVKTGYRLPGTPHHTEVTKGSGLGSGRRICEGE